MVFLQSHGVSTTYAIKIYKLYAGEAVARVRENPYRLAREVRGIGFKSADRIARHLEHRRRLAAARRRRDRPARCCVTPPTSGHVFMPRSKLLADTSELLEVDGRADRSAARRAWSPQGELAAVTSADLTDASERPAGPAAIYLKPLEVAERGVAELFQVTDRPAAPCRFRSTSTAPSNGSRPGRRSSWRGSSARPCSHAISCKADGADRRAGHRQDDAGQGHRAHPRREGAAHPTGGTHRPRRQAPERGDRGRGKNRASAARVQPTRAPGVQPRRRQSAGPPTC